MSFQEYLKESATQVELQLQTYTQKRALETTNKYPITNELINAFVDSCEWGKRLRAVLVKLWYEIANWNPQKNIYIPAIWVEIFQTAILAHDDIIDKSDLRRGKPTLYKSLWWDHYGISQTICLGDIWLLLASKTMIEWDDFDDNIKIRATHHFIDMIINTWIGEMIDVKLPTLANPWYEEIISVCKLKTAEYTINTPIKLGALFAWRNDKQLEVFDDFAVNLGIAFQIKDDILWIFWDSKTIGKSIDSDIVEWKKTLLRLWAHDHMTQSQKDIRNNIYGNLNVTENDINQIREILQLCGAYEYATLEMQKYANLAKQSISKITQDPKYISLLEDFVDLMINRSK
jgi:geranylgeranyl diphosphate synthase, type I